jgi:hypothetical protein
MRLRDLDAEFLTILPDGTWMRIGEKLEGAYGIRFQCPKCADGKEVVEEDGKRFVRGAHLVICWFVGKVLDDLDPKPGRWTPSGTGLDDLTFVPPGSVSVMLLGGCGWHGHIRNGEATLT